MPVPSHAPACTAPPTVTGPSRAHGRTPPPPPAPRSPGPASRPAPRAADTPSWGRLRAPPRDLFLVDLDTFYVSVERVRDPSLVGRPVIVGGQPGERGVVACASYEARAYGAHAGMPLGRAASLCPPGTVFLHGDHAAYTSASKQVFSILERFTPSIEPLSLDEALLDLTGCDRHHRSWLAAARSLHDQIAEETGGLQVSIGISGTRAVAKIAADLAKPSGVLEVKRGEEHAFLSALPIEILPGVGPRMRQQLARFNLHTVGDLAQIPEDVLEETFGQSGVALCRRARGLESDHDHAPVGTTTPRTRSISRETSFAQDTADLRFIDGMISYLAQRATNALRKAGFLARAVGVRLRYADFKTVDVRRRLPRPSDFDDEILGLARQLWRERYDRRVQLRLIGVVLHDLVPVGDRQLELPFAASMVSEPVVSDAAATGARIPPHDGASLHRDRSVLAGPRLPASAGVSVHERLDAAVDQVRERHGFGALVRGNAVQLFGRLPRSAHGFRLHTPACSR